MTESRHVIKKKKKNEILFLLTNKQEVITFQIGLGPLGTMNSKLATALHAPLINLISYKVIQ